ncbi:DUF4252 domain-containing protein [Prevotella denticola]|uniref:DUF4252 domain-containing protein n=1 Tax=Prevotella denticola TaxID=28129 RepID=UPI000201302A|nr:DUF4252 domain-containing protein [Prevotella denticola]AEA21400.1 hypothetical protein HMPREF9137_0637 [Prevotella denticola F0289]QUB88294.1 DUF4252 domain-containing protein [Prevotella denticola]
MKRVLILFILAISVLDISAQSVEGLIRQYRHEKHADYVHIPRLVMSMARLFVKEDTEDAKVVKAVSSIRVLDLEDCPAAVRENFRKTLSTFRPAGYTPVIFNKEADATSRIYIREKKGYVRELLILSADNTDGAIVQIKGKIRPEDVDRVAEQNTKKGKRGKKTTSL